MLHVLSWFGLPVFPRWLQLMISCPLADDTCSVLHDDPSTRIYFCRFSSAESRDERLKHGKVPPSVHAETSPIKDARTYSCPVNNDVTSTREIEANELMKLSSCCTKRRGSSVCFPTMKPPPPSNSLSSVNLKRLESRRSRPRLCMLLHYAKHFPPTDRLDVFWVALSVG